MSLIDYDDIIDKPAGKKGIPTYILGLLVASVVGTISGFVFKVLRWPGGDVLLGVGFILFYIKPRKLLTDWLYLWAITCLLPGVYMQLLHFKAGNYFIVTAVIIFIIHAILRYVLPKRNERSGQKQSD